MIKFAFHIHSTYSKDSLSSPRQIIDYCRKNEIKAIAVTDHNEIAGAFLAEKLAQGCPFVIIGEEIRSSDGDIIGLFIKNKINPGMSAGETIKAIKDQKGLVCLPHPGESLRREAITKAKSDEIISEADIIEIFNSRTLLDKDNKWAETRAKKYNKSVVMGSDAHFVFEIGRAINFVHPFSDRESFLKSIAGNNRGAAVRKRTNILIQACSKAVVIYKKTIK